MAFPVGELFILGFSGVAVPHWLKEFAERYGLGGVILFDFDWVRNKPERNVLSRDQLKNLCTDVHALPTRPLITIDQEGGAVCRLKTIRGFKPLPSQQELAAQPKGKRTKLLQEAYQELKALGIDYNLAPVVDVNLNPDNPDIGAIGRSFSSDPKEVKANVEVVNEVASRVGLGLCLKHYPGLGGAKTDSHRGMTDLSEVLDKAQLNLFHELAPTIAGSAVLISHGYVKQWDKNLPASISKAAVDKLREHAPDVLAICDDLQMEGLQHVMPTDEACEQGLRAGLDMLLVGNNMMPGEAEAPRLAEALAAAIEKDKTLAANADAALTRIRERKAQFSG